MMTNAAVSLPFLPLGSLDVEMQPSSATPPRNGAATITAERPLSGRSSSRSPHHSRRSTVSAGRRADQGRTGTFTTFDGEGDPPDVTLGSRPPASQCPLGIRMYSRSSYTRPWSGSGPGYTVTTIPPASLVEIIVTVEATCDEPELDDLGRIVLDPSGLVTDAVSGDAGRQRQGVSSPGTSSSPRASSADDATPMTCQDQQVEGADPHRVTSRRRTCRGRRRRRIDPQLDPM